VRCGPPLYQTKQYKVCGCQIGSDCLKLDARATKNLLAGRDGFDQARICLVTFSDQGMRREIFALIWTTPARTRWRASLMLLAIVTAAQIVNCSTALLA
jgi:hypothetical protein